MAAGRQGAAAPLLSSGRSRRHHLALVMGMLTVLSMVAAAALLSRGAAQLMMLSADKASTSMLDEPECSTDYCRMERACSTNAGDAEACYAVEPLCAECGERKPCYYAFGRCKLRNGYGPKYDNEEDQGELQTAKSASAAEGQETAAEGKKTGAWGGLMDEGVGPDEPEEIHGNPVLPIFERDKVKKGGLVTVDPRHGEHEEETPEAVNTLANVSTVGVGPELEKGPQLQFCQWGSEMVPCAPGYGGAWLEHHTEDAGIWPHMDEGKHVSVRHHVKAGRRSHSYIDDIFQYGEGGIFGAHKIGGPRVMEGGMLSGGHDNTQQRPAASGAAQARAPAARWRQGQLQRMAAAGERRGGVEAAERDLAAVQRERVAAARKRELRLRAEEAARQQQLHRQLARLI